MAPRLESLSIAYGTPLCNTAWLPAMRTLQHADLAFAGGLHGPLPVGINCLTALRSLTVTSLDNALAPGATLPNSLSKLCLFGPYFSPFEEEMPPQFLSADLLRLELNYVPYTSAGFHGLNRLSGLTSLVMRKCRLPASLSALTGLRQLELENWRRRAADASSTEQLDALLAPLTALTCLMLWGAHSFATPQALAQLGQLQRCMVYSQAAPATAAEEDDDEEGDRKSVV